MSENRGWQIFLIGLLISVFLGGAVRVMFSPERMRLLVEDIVARKEPKFKLTFKHAHLTLADGFMPSFAIEFKDLELSAKDQCRSASTIFAERVNLPFNLRALLKNNVRLGHVVFENVKIQYGPPVCEAVNTSKSTSAKAKEPFNKLFVVGWDKSFERTVRLVDELSIYNAEFLSTESNVDKVIGTALNLLKVKELNIRPDPVQKKLLLRASIYPPLDVKDEFRVGPMNIKTDIAKDSITVTGQGLISEGQYKLKAVWLTESDLFNSELNLKDLPMQVALSVLANWNLIHAPKVKTKNEWLTCRIELSGFLAEIKKSKGELNDCRFYGDLGDWQVRGGNIFPLDGKLYPLMINARAMNVRSFAEAAGWQDFNEHIIQHGQFDFSLEYLGQSEFNVKCIWHKPVLQYRVQDTILTLPVLQTQVSIDARNEDIVVTFRDLLWANGKFEGVAQFTKDKMRDELDITWSLRAETLPPLALNYLGINDAKEVASEGQMRLTDRKIKNAKINYKFSNLKGFDTEVEGADMNIQVEEGLEFWNFAFKGIKLNPEPRWRAWLEVLEKENLFFTFVQGQLKFEAPGRWFIDKLTATESFIFYDIKGRGFKTGIDQLSLTTSSKYNNEKNKVYKAFGTLLEPVVERQ
jgi:hypothetical protein